MRDALKSYLALAGGMSELTKQRAVTAAKQLVAQGEATAGQVQELAEDLLQQSRSNREAVTALVRFEVDKALGRVGLATQDEVEALRAKVRTLESQLASSGGSSASSVGAPSSRGAAAKKAAGAKPPARSAAASKTATKTASKTKTATKAPAKKAAKAAPAKRGRA